MKRLAWTADNKQLDFLFAVNAGMVQGAEQIRKYGANYDIDPASSPELVRDGGGTIDEYPFFDTNTELYLISDNPLCTTDVHILGLVDDGEGNWVNKDVYVEVNGTTPVSIGEWVRVFRVRPQIEVATVGNIYITDIQAVPTEQINVVARVQEGKGSTLMAMYTVPSGYTAYLYRIFASCGRSQDAYFNYVIRPYNKAWHTTGEVSLYETAWQGEIGYEKVKEKSDIAVIASTLTNNTQVRASFHFVLVDNRFL